jgi:hypothetical protein
MLGDDDHHYKGHAIVKGVVAVHDAVHDHVKSAVHKVVDIVKDIHDKKEHGCDCEKECDDCECDCGKDEKAVKLEVVKEKVDGCEKDCEHGKEPKHHDCHDCGDDDYEVKFGHVHHQLFKHG